MSDILNRVFGQDPGDPNFRRLNESKIIPVHDCEYVETKMWTWTGFAFAQQCKVCRESPPPLPTPPEDIDV